MIIENMPFEEYQQREGLNASVLKLVDDLSMQHVRAALDGTRKIESDALTFGKCFHSLLLENREDFIEKPATYPAPASHAKVKKKEIEEGSPLKWNGNSAYCKEWEEKQTLEVLSAYDIRNLRGMCGVLRNDPVIGPLLNGGKREVSAFAEKNGQKYKCRTDLLTAGNGPVIDFKSASFAKPEAFLSSAIDHGYHVQAAVNLDVLRWNDIVRDEFWCVAIEPEPPHAHCIIKFKDTCLSFLRVGRARYRVAAQKIKNAIEKNEWPGYEGGDAEDFAKPWMQALLDTTA